MLKPNITQYCAVPVFVATESQVTRYRVRLEAPDSVFIIYQWSFFCVNYVYWTRELNRSYKLEEAVRHSNTVEYTVQEIYASTVKGSV